MTRWLPLAAVATTVATVCTLMLGAAGAFYAQGARGVCATEDSPSCVWVGPVQGNGRGRVVVNGPELDTP